MDHGQIESRKTAGGMVSDDELGIRVIDSNLMNLSPEKRKEILKVIKASFEVYFNDPKK